MEEVKSRALDIPETDREMFPKEGVVFFMESFEEYYGCHITQSRSITGLDEWFEGYPVKQNDTIIISKYSEGYYLVPLSEIVDQQQHFNLEMERILLLEPEDILCPNCRYRLEHAGLGSTEDSYILKCARCGFTLVKKSHFD
jgi:DNA-directed RNA polymerase subunit RPC12/RpoP